MEFLHAVMTTEIMGFVEGFVWRQLFVTVQLCPTRVALAASPVALGAALVPPLKSTLPPDAPDAVTDAARETRMAST